MRKKLKKAIAEVLSMVQCQKRDTVVSALLVIGVFYFSFMILDRVLSLIYGFNFQPYGRHMPPGFTFWGHVFDGSMAAVGLFIVFKLYDHGKSREMWFLQVLALSVFLVIGAIIPYMNDAAYIESQGQGNTIPIYVIGNDLYVFSWGLLMFKIAKSINKKAMVLVMIFVTFLIAHFVLYAPMFPEFYWS